MNESVVPSAANRGGLTSWSFLGLLFTQFFGAFNDNMFRWLAVPIGKATPLLDDETALSLGLACFTVPYLLFATPAGFLADRFSKRKVIVGCKIAEIVIMLLGIIAIFSGSLLFMFAVVGLMGAQSALFGPAKFGSIPEMLDETKLSTGNGWMGLVTVVGSALGFLAGNVLYGFVQPDPTAPIGWGHLVPAAAALVGVAVIGWGFSLLICRLPVADPERAIPWNLAADTIDSLKTLGRNRNLLRTALGITFFWMLASLAQLNIDPYGIKDLSLTQRDIGILGLVLVLGVGLGSVLAGLWSGDKVELGIVPLGATGITITSGMLYFSGTGPDGGTFGWSCVALFLLGISAGFFDVPLEANLQHRSDVRVRGKVLAATNFLAFAAILFSAGLFWVLQSQLELTASAIFLLVALGTIPVTVYIFKLLPDASIRCVAWLLSHTMYRVRVRGRENLPEHGGALLVANHVSWIDGILLLITSSRPIRMLAYADYVQNSWVGWLARIYGVIPIKAGSGPKALLRSLNSAREAVQNGDVVCIFAEGALTRSGQLLGFQSGLMRIVSGTDAPVIPVYLDGLWGSVFSFRGGRFFWKLPRKWPYPVSIHFGKPLTHPDHVEQVRLAVQQLGADAVKEREQRGRVPARQFVRKCRRRLFHEKVADSSGLRMTGGKLLTSTLALKRCLERLVLAPDERNVGVLLPPSVGGTLANAAISLSGRVPVNLNYTLSNNEVQYCIDQAGLRHVITSRKFLEKRPFEVSAEFVCLEDLKPRISRADKIRSALAVYILPSIVLERVLGLHRIHSDDLMTIIFTSGSTGEPKGVMLSHMNVMSNIDAVDQLFQIAADDVLLGVLPFFHSLGFTGTLWLPLTLNPKVVFHFNPLDAREVGQLCGGHGVSMILATPTFLRAYLKRCEKEQMQRLDLVVAGAEKLPADLVEAFHKKFGVTPIEGYGTTELSPLASVNVPDHRTDVYEQTGTKPGTVGRAVPGVAAKVIDPDTGEALGVDREGLLQIRGPNVMLGYLNLPDKTAEVLHDGWYNTGDMARIDADGFIEITGRMSRFSKLGGEMVPHLKIEETLARIVEDSDENGEPLVAVTAVPDPKKGERIVVVHRPLSKPIDQIRRELAEAGLPNLWIPSADSFVEVAEVPVLGTGKLDLKGLKQLAMERFDPALAGR